MAFPQHNSLIKIASGSSLEHLQCLQDRGMALVNGQNCKWQMVVKSFKPSEI